MPRLSIAQRLLKITRASSDSRAAVKPKGQYPNSDFVPFTDNDRFDACDAFTIDSNYDQTLLGSCPPTLAAMMVIVSKIREQRVQHLAKFNYHIDQSSTLSSSYPVEHRSSNNSSSPSPSTGLATSFDLL